MLRRVAVALAGLLSIPAVASAQLPTCGGASGIPNSQLPGIHVGITSPFAWVFINEQCTDLSKYILPGVTAGKTWTMTTGRLDIGGIIIDANANFNADPFITFGA